MKSNAIYIPPLVEDFEEVIENVERFNTDLKSSAELVSKLKQFKHWYYVPEVDSFGPSKYIGYEGMTAGLYSRDGMDGRDTEVALRGWFRTVDPDTDLDVRLKDQLSTILALYGKSIKQNAFIHVPIDYTGDALDEQGKRAIEVLGELDLESKVQMSEEEFEKWVKEESGDASIEVRFGVKKIRRYQQSVIKRLKERYAGTCQICGWSSLEEFGVDISEAHHIEHFSMTLNNKPSNILIVCPSHHRLIHALDATLDRERKTLVGIRGERLPLRINKHL